MLSEGHSDAAKYGPLCGIDPAPKEAFTLSALGTCFEYGARAHRQHTRVALTEIPRPLMVVVLEPRPLAVLLMRSFSLEH